MRDPLTTTDIRGLSTPKKGKVRDIYDLGEYLLIVTTDRISAYDHVLPTGIPDKGRVLQELTSHWINEAGFGLHPDIITTTILRIVDFLSTSGLPQAADYLGEHQYTFHGRTALVRKAKPFPVECVVRGYLAGSGWKEYQKNGKVCGIKLASNLNESAVLEKPIFTPATKAEQGEHDENISFEKMCEIVGEDYAQELRKRSLDLYMKGNLYASQRGIIIADTKFEWGIVDGAIVIIDEILTPDSSRFWPADQYRPGRGQPSFDKQFVRDWLTQKSGWDKESPPPELPQDVVEKTRAKYIEACERLTSTTFPWI